VRPGRPSAAPRRSVARSAPWWSVASPPRTGRRFSGSWRKPFADLPRSSRPSEGGALRRAPRRGRPGRPPHPGRLGGRAAGRAVALLGSTTFYRRFGFVPASDLGIEAPDPSWGDEFQVRAVDAYDPAPRGALRYAPAFAAVGAGSGAERGGGL